MTRIDIRTPGPNRTRAMAMIMSALPRDGARVCYARIGMVAGEEVGPLVGDLIEDGRIACETVDGTMVYSRGPRLKAA